MYEVVEEVEYKQSLKEKFWVRIYYTPKGEVVEANARLISRLSL
jgi:hypothetical protein